MEKKYRLGHSLEVRVNFVAIGFCACVMLWTFCHGCSASPAGIYLTGGAKAAPLVDALDSGPKASTPDLSPPVIDVEYPMPPDVQVATRVDTSPLKDSATPDLVRVIDTQAADIFKADAGMVDAKPVAKDAGASPDVKVFPPIPDAGICDGGYTRWFWDGVGAWTNPECVYDAARPK